MENKCNSKKEKIMDLTSREILELIELRNDGSYISDLAMKYNVSKALVDRLSKAYNGEAEYYNLLGGKYQLMIDNLKKLKEPQKYEVKILFGLITLKINPVVG